MLISGLFFRPNLQLGKGQDQLIAAIVSAQRNTIVVVHTPGSVLMPWASDIPAILCAWMPGQEDGKKSQSLHKLYQLKTLMICIILCGNR